MMGLGGAPQRVLPITGHRANDVADQKSRIVMQDLPSVPAQWEAEADIAVSGFGTAGMAAPVTAHELGARGADCAMVMIVDHG